MMTLPTVLKLAALLLSLGLDTFAVAVGLGMRRLEPRQQIHYGIAFALAEGTMPLLGFLLGSVVASVASGIASWAAIALLAAVGAYVIYEGMEGESRDVHARSLFTLIGLALSVSLDELAVGFSLGLLHLPLLLAAGLIALQAFLLTLLGLRIGHAVGDRFSTRAGILSGLVLIALAIALFIERIHT